MIRQLALGLSLLSAWPGAAAAEMLTIPEGTLWMGSMAGEPAERPLHGVFVSRFEIDRYEVTNAEFAEFVVATDYVTDVERNGRGWHWETRWRQVQAAGRLCGAVLTHASGWGHLVYPDQPMAPPAHPQ